MHNEINTNDEEFFIKFITFFIESINIFCDSNWSCLPFLQWWMDVLKWFYLLGFRTILQFLFFLLGSSTGVSHYFGAIFWHPHASSQHYFPASPPRAIQFLFRWEQRRLSVPTRAQTRDLCRCRIPSVRQ